MSPQKCLIIKQNNKGIQPEHARSHTFERACFGYEIEVLQLSIPFLVVQRRGLA
jgi:hypothetical protein